MTFNDSLEHDRDSRPTVQKVWGAEEIIINDPAAGYCGKILWLEAGHAGSLHYHSVKHETMLCLEGLVKVEVQRRGQAPETTVLRGWARDAIVLPPYTVHRLEALDGPAMIVEFSTPHNDNDVVRLEASR
jgi:quercetin dioxygenase-like cupin family protein